ncbi:hypothetical protein [Brachybacterium aquaticum]|uniref:Uncharacterized protein n=1 Tax=Brachybacterium aquaticum TaxID=1432564 RepID=A0A841AI12_9MICO|nr:hypothetical protein [Brachybacterium aquaticum]MBB5832678.1 hypothetical protein [Brachybacterium aquaticum]
MGDRLTADVLRADSLLADSLLAAPPFAGTAPFEGDGFWDPVPASWPLMAILLAVCLLLTIAFVVWLVLQPEEPDVDTTPLVDKATRHDREDAALVRRRMDADAGRADLSDPQLR